MIRILFASFCVLSIVCKSVGQSYSKGDPTIAKYYYYTNLAELAIVDSSYQKSIAFYNQAFTYKNPNPRDISNGLRLGILLNDTNFSRICFNKLAVNGLSKAIIENFLGKEIFLGNGLYKHIENDYDSLFAIFENTSKIKYGVMLNELLLRDQNVRQNKHTNQDQIKTDYNNIDSLLWFNEMFGFPGFHLLGFEGSGIGDGGTFQMIHWHNRNMPIGPLDSIGLIAVLQGLYPPDEFAYVEDFKTYPNKYQILIPDLAAMDKSKEHFSKDIVNKYRAEIYLESVDDFKKKFIFMKNRKGDWFKFLLMSQNVFVINAVN